MANLIEATVYQIDGNPQKDIITVAFDTNKIRLQETTVSTIPQVTSFIEVEGEKLNAPVVRYFVSETVATLVSAANTGGTTLLQATVVAINENPFKVAKQMAFPANKVTVWSFINGTIQSFLQLNEDKFYATEDKATLIAAANAGGGFPGAQNGLNTDYGPVELGGELTKNTTIDISDYTFNFNDGQGWNFQMLTGQMSFGLTDEVDGNNSFIQILNNTITNEVIASDGDSSVSTLQNSYLYKITTNQYYIDWDTNNQYDILTGFYSIFTQLRFNYFNNDTGNTYSAAFTISNTMGAEGNFIQRYNFQNVPSFADNGAAISAGLQSGDIYILLDGGGFGSPKKLCIVS
jgi:hypothetical protein